MAWNVDDDFTRIFEKIFKQLSFPDKLDAEPPNLRSWSYGYSMTTGPDGKPIIKEWGTGLPETPMGGHPNDAPLLQVDIDRVNKKVRVIMELPGVTKESIRITGTETSVRVKANNDKWNVDHEIPISAKVDPITAKASYNNGVLDITLELIEESDPEGVDIQVN
jgi:HSP20 family protein